MSKEFTENLYRVASRQTGIIIREHAAKECKTMYKAITITGGAVTQVKKDDIGVVQDQGYNPDCFIWCFEHQLEDAVAKLHKAVGERLEARINELKAHGRALNTRPGFVKFMDLDEEELVEITDDML